MPPSTNPGQLAPPAGVAACVLVLEPDDLVAELLTECLIQHGLAVRRAQNCAVAQMLLDTTVDAALIDCSPYSSAIESVVLQADHLTVPVLLMTTNPQQPPSSHMHDRPILTKPFRLDELVDLVGRYLACSRSEPVFGDHP